MKTSKPIFRITFQEDGVLFTNVTPHATHWAWSIMNPDYFFSYQFSFYPKCVHYAR